MSEARYIISDAAKKLSLEPHVLRYWEEEMDLDIPRNEMGHRFYRESDIECFFGIKRLKEYGFHLRAIKFLLPDLKKVSAFSKEQLMELRYELESKTTAPAVPVPSSVSVAPDQKMEQFKEILSRIVSDALQGSEQVISHTVTENVAKEMDYMFRQKEEADEERYRTLDETIRNFQQARKESAVSLTQTKTPEKRRKFGNFFFSKT